LRTRSHRSRDQYSSHGSAIQEWSKLDLHPLGVLSVMARFVLLWLEPLSGCLKFDLVWLFDVYVLFVASADIVLFIRDMEIG
jgi:hypothetical protein